MIHLCVEQRIEDIEDKAGFLAPISIHVFMVEAETTVFRAIDGMFRNGRED